DFSDSFDGPEPTIISKDSWNKLQCISKGSNSVLFNTSNLAKDKPPALKENKNLKQNINRKKVRSEKISYVISFLINSNRASKFRRPTSINNFVAFNQVSNDTKRVMD